MKTDAAHRLRYHPRPDARGRRPRGARKVRRRWAAIERHCDLAGAVVLDLGCSGGYMSFRAAQSARRVIGVDADPEVIAHNRRWAHQLGMDHLEFIEAILTPELISELPQADVTLLLSVLHHIIAGSQAYDWNERPGNRTQVHDLIAAVAERSRTLVLEVGEPHESHEWAPALAFMEPDPAGWITENLLRPHYPQVQVLDPPDLAGLGGWFRRQLHYRFPHAETSRSIAARILRRLADHDTRDARHLFIAQRANGFGR